MANDLLPVWHQVEWYLNNTISIIPVRDKIENDKLPKTPYQGWKVYQTNIISKDELFHQMDQHGTSAVAMICGKVSNGLEVIDIDVKYRPGIDAVIMSDIKQLYPDLFTKLRIHKTPSGGYHILYRVPDHEIPGNMKLAGRHKTADELLVSPKPKIVNFIETRGEGGYAVAPPSLNYAVHIDNPIPSLTWEERCSLIKLCQTYTDLIELEKPYRPTKSDSDYYDENPFEHFNASPEGEAVLIDNGWKYFKHSNQFVWFTHPGSKNGGVHASFNKSKRVFFIFTSSTEFDENKGYNPATALSILLHNGDKKKTFRYLSGKGYGKIKPHIEKQLAKTKAASGRPLPANASRDAQVEYEAERVHLQTTYPFGIFWEKDEENKLKISRERLYMVAEGLGYRLYTTDPVRIDGYVVKKQTQRQFYDGLKAYIKEKDGDEYISIVNCLEAFIEAHGSFTITRLPLLDHAQLVRDTSNSAYKFYNNGYLFITSQLVSFHTYDTLSGLIWDDQILPRQYNAGPESGRYRQFIELATPYTANVEHIRKIIGYLSHQFKDETTGYIIVITEQCEDPKQGGGSGKNIFSSLFSLTTTYKSIPGSQVKYDEKFMQAWNRERIYAVSDVPKKFDFLFLKELSTGSGILKKLWKDEVAIEVADMPKFIIQTNYSFEITDGGLRRRIIAIEFTDHFTKAGGVDVHFGCHFPKGWELQDWTGYDNMIANCVKEWLAGGLKLHPVALTESGWVKQFSQSWGQVIHDIIAEYMEKWMALKWVSGEVFKNHIDEFYRENNTPNSYRPAMNRIYAGISEWCKHYENQFINNINHRDSMGNPCKHKWFGKSDETPFD